MSIATITDTPSGDMLCYYANHTRHPQIARIMNSPNQSFERIVQPGQSILFQAETIAQLEIHTFTAISTLMANTISCASLRVSDELISNLLSHLS